MWLGVLCSLTLVLIALVLRFFMVGGGGVFCGLACCVGLVVGDLCLVSLYVVIFDL